jgi:predicted adenine nucleotide alpha hydrolase (AANH) superfamily ATPase
LKLLLHSCCGPCTIYPLSVLREDYDISTIFFNPNIHPYKEYKRRKNTLYEFCQRENIPIVGSYDYGLKEYLRRVVNNEDQKCRICYSWRMDETARVAKESGFSHFTTTLLYSRYQDHERLKKYGYSLAETYGINFVYGDFRQGWQQGIDLSIEEGMYRQPYCGCIYSEQERYDKSLRKR